MYFIGQTLMMLKKHNSVIKSWLKKDTKTTDRHTGQGKGCPVWCPAWRRGWRLPLCWTETSCLCAAPVWLQMGKKKKPWMQHGDSFSIMSKALSDSSLMQTRLHTRSQIPVELNINSKHCRTHKPWVNVVLWHVGGVYRIISDKGLLL